MASTRHIERRQQSGLAIRLRQAVLATCLCPVTLVLADHVGIDPPTPGPSLVLIVGPVTSPASAAVVTFDLSATPQLVGTGPLGGTPVILIEMGARRGPGGPSNDFTAELRAAAPPSLLSGSNQIPISDISWTSVLPAGASYTDVIPAGTYAAGTQVIASLPVFGGAARWIGGELTFQFANTTIYPAGTYGGPGNAVTYTAHMVP